MTGTVFVLLGTALPAAAGRPARLALPPRKLGRICFSQVPPLAYCPNSVERSPKVDNGIGFVVATRL